MARGKKTGGRNFTGLDDPRRARHRGPDRVPRGSIKAVMQMIATENAVEVRDALLRAIRSLRYSVPVISLLAHYVDGKPPDRIEVRAAEVPVHDLSRLSDDELHLLEDLLKKATPPLDDIPPRPFNSADR
jgi:hypothetical protein